MKFGIGVLYIKLSSKRECRESRLSDSRTLLRGANEFLLARTVFLDGCG